MKIKTEIVRDKDLSRSQMALMNKWRVKQFGPQNRKNFKKDYWPNPKFFFLKDNGKIVSFGILREIKMNYLGKDYKIEGFCSIISVVKMRGYGKMLIHDMIDYLKKTGKTGLGFCGEKNSKFYEKAGLKVKKDLADRFALKNPKTGKIRFDEEGGDGLYFEGKDNLIKKVLSTKGTGYYYLPDIDKGGPHW